MNIKKSLKRLGVIIGVTLVVLWVIGFIMIKAGYEPKPRTPSVQSTAPEKTETSPPAALNEIQTIQSKNLLLQKPLTEAPILNSENKQLGTWAYIIIPPNLFFDSVTLDDITEFHATFAHKKYNRVTIVCTNGHGLVFYGDNFRVAEYAKIDKTGRMDGKTKWAIAYDNETSKFKLLK